MTSIPELYCPKCAAAMDRAANGELTCVAGDMGLSRNLEKTLLERFGAVVDAKAFAPPTGASWFCPACRLALTADLNCPNGNGSLKDLRFQLVEIHPHRDWPPRDRWMPAQAAAIALVGQVMPLLIEGEHPTLAMLREQYARSTIREVYVRTEGFFAHFDVPADIARVTPPSIFGGQVEIQLEGRQYLAGCMLFVKNGALNTVAAHTCFEPWPERPVVVSLRTKRTLPIPTSRVP